MEFDANIRYVTYSSSALLMGLLIEKIAEISDCISVIYGVRQIDFFCSFLRIGSVFQGEIFHTYVVIIYVHIGIKLNII